MPPLNTLNKTALTLAITQAVAMTSAQAAEIRVNDFSDDINSSGCTLRQAIVSANTNSAPSGSNCVVGSSGDTIRFDNASPQTISLTQGPLSITTVLDILGPFHTPIVIDGSGNSAGADNIVIDTFGVVTLDHLTIQSARDDGISVSAGSAAVISNSTITDNLGIGAVGLNGTSISIERSTISSNGSGDANRGGGVYSLGVVGIYYSTISDNTAAIEGGGLFIGGSGDPRYLNINVSTITNNSAGVQGGGIFAASSDSSVSILNSIVSGNMAGTSGSEIAGSANADFSSNNNVLGSSDSSNGQAFVNFTPNDFLVLPDIDATSDHDDIALNAIINTQLADNGGPNKTHNLVSGSVAINANNDSFFCNRADQRSESRGDIGDGCDVGAVEYLPINQTIVVDTILGNGTSTSTCSLFEALRLVDDNKVNYGCGSVGGGVDDIITFAAGIDTVTLTDNLQRISSDVTIQGGSGVTIDAGGARRILEISDGGSAVFNNMTLTNASASSYGGAALLVARDAYATLTNSTINNNQSAGSGGGINVLRDSVLNVSDSTISNNQSAGNGSGIGVLNNSVLNVSDSTISNNFGGSGIGVQNNSVLNVSDSTISNNFGGGGIGVLNNSVLNVSDSAISNNFGDRGGAIYAISSRIAIERSTISENSATVDFGGGVAIAGSSSSMMIQNSTISNNTADTNAGAVFVFSGAQASIVNTSIVDNRFEAATGPGGVGANGTGSIINLQNTLLSNSGFDARAVANSVINSLGNNLFGNSTKTNAQAIGGFSPVSSDITATSDGTNPTVASALFGPLSDNGGPTLTHALVSGSPAINAANNGACPSTDQRGESRDARCDIGAFEFFDEEEACFVVPTANGGVVTFCL